MENDDTTKRERETAKELPASTTNVQTNKQAAKSKTANKKTRKYKKWSLRRYWKAASRKQQFKWVLEVIGAIVAAGILFIYILGLPANAMEL